MSPEGKPHRLSLTAYMDAKSSIIVGYNPCDDPCFQSITNALVKNAKAKNIERWKQFNRKYDKISKELYE